MKIDSTERLILCVRTALLAADALGLADAALHLNDALVVLTGEGIAPDAAVEDMLH